MSDKLILAVDAQIAALVPCFIANRAADSNGMRAALAGADFDAMRVAAAISAFVASREAYLARIEIKPGAG
ncbi:MAG: hypothetical protein ACTS6J_12235 [Burkholderiales bacterium]